MIKKAILSGVLSVYSLCALSPFAVSIAGAENIVDNYAYYNFYGFELEYTTGADPYTPPAEQAPAVTYGVAGVLGAMPNISTTMSNYRNDKLVFNVDNGAINGVRFYESLAYGYSLTTYDVVDNFTMRRTGVCLTDLLDSSLPYKFRTGYAVDCTLSITVAWYGIGEDVQNPHIYIDTIECADDTPFYFSFPADMLDLPIVNADIIYSFQFDSPTDFTLTADMSYAGDFYFQPVSYVGLLEETLVKDYFPPQDFDFVGAILDNVDSMLHFEIFPNFSFFDIMYIVFGISFFFFILKVFLGG